MPHLHDGVVSGANSMPCHAERGCSSERSCQGACHPAPLPLAQCMAQRHAPAEARVQEYASGGKGQVKKLSQCTGVQCTPLGYLAQANTSC